MGMQNLCRLCLSYASEYDSEEIIVTEIVKLRNFIPRDLLDPKHLKHHISCPTCIKNVAVVKKLLARINASNSYVYYASGKLNVKSIEMRELKQVKKIPDSCTVCQICLKPILVENIALYLYDNPVNLLPVEMVQDIMKKAKLTRVRLIGSKDDVICENCWEDIKIAYTFKKTWDQVEKRINSYCCTKKISSFFINCDDLENIVKLYQVESDVDVEFTSRTEGTLHAGQIKMEPEETPDSNDIGCEMIIKNEPYDDDTLSDQLFEEQESDNESPPALELQGLCVYNPACSQKTISPANTAELPPTLEPQTLCSKSDIKIQNVYSLQEEGNLMVAISKSDQEMAIKALLDTKRDVQNPDLLHGELGYRGRYYKPKGKSRELLKCGLCDFATYFFGPFERHKKYHQKNRIRFYDCHYCGFTTSRKSLCDLHIKNHAKKTVIKRTSKVPMEMSTMTEHDNLSSNILDFKGQSTFGSSGVHREVQINLSVKESSPDLPKISPQGCHKDDKQKIQIIRNVDIKPLKYSHNVENMTRVEPNGNKRMTRSMLNLKEQRKRKSFICESNQQITNSVLNGNISKQQTQTKSPKLIRIEGNLREILRNKFNYTKDIKSSTNQAQTDVENLKLLKKLIRTEKPPSESATKAFSYGDGQYKLMGSSLKLIKKQENNAESEKLKKISSMESVSSVSTLKDNRKVTQNIKSNNIVANLVENVNNSKSKTLKVNPSSKLSQLSNSNCTKEQFNSQMSSEHNSLAFLKVPTSLKIQRVRNSENSNNQGSMKNLTPKVANNIGGGAETSKAFPSLELQKSLKDKESNRKPMIQEIIHYGKVPNSEIMSYEVKKEVLDQVNTL